MLVPSVKLEITLRGAAKNDVLKEIFAEEPEEGCGIYWYGNESRELAGGVKITLRQYDT
jgi:hypothetical protein